MGDPAIAALLTSRGYQLISFEKVLGRRLREERWPEPPLGVEVRLSGDDEFAAWLDAAAEGVAHPDPQGVASYEAYPRQVIDNAERDFASAGVARYVALLHGAIAVGGSMHIAEALRSSLGPRPCLSTVGVVCRLRCC